MSKSKGRHARNKGFSFERWIVAWWQSLGYEEAARTRRVHPELDDKKVDITNTGKYHTQCKAIENNIDLHKILDSMPNDGKTNLVMHKKNRRGTVVSMRLESFAQLLDDIDRNCEDCEETLNRIKQALREN